MWARRRIEVVTYRYLTVRLILEIGCPTKSSLYCI